MAQLLDERHRHTLDGELRRTRVAQAVRMHALLNACLTPELRNEVVEELISDLVGENRAELDAPLVRGGRNRGMESEKGRR